MICNEGMTSLILCLKGIVRCNRVYFKYGIVGMLYFLGIIEIWENGSGKIAGGNQAKFGDLWMVFDFWLKNRVDIEIFWWWNLGRMEWGKVGNVLICWEIWRDEGELLRKYQSSRQFKNNSLIVKVII